jgi:CBS domain-containing protein
MQVREAMSSDVLVVGPEHTLREAARMMSSRGIGSAIVIDPDSAGVGIMTERDILNAIGAGLDCDVERTAAHLTWDAVYAGPDWTIEEAAAAMAHGGFRHLVVIEASEVLGVISVRDLMRVWAGGRPVAPR